MSSRRSSTSSSRSMNWDLGLDWYRAPLSDDRFGPRRDLAPLHEPARAPTASPRGSARRSARTRSLIYMVRHPIEPPPLPLPTRRRRRLREPRACRRAEPAVQTRTSSAASTAMQLEPYLEALRSRADPRRLAGGARRDARRDGAQGLRLRRRGSRLHLRAVRPRVGDGSGKGKGGTGSMERCAAARAPVVRPQLRPPPRADALDGRDGSSTIPSRARPQSPSSSPRSRATAAATFRPDVAGSRRSSGARWAGSIVRRRSLGRVDVLRCGACAISVAADELTGIADAVAEELRDRGHEPVLHGALATTSATTGPGPRRPPRATSPRAAPIRPSSAAGPARAPRSPPTRCPASAPPSAPTRRRPREPGDGTTRTSSR